MLQDLEQNEARESCLPEALYHHATATSKRRQQQVPQNFHSPFISPSLTAIMIPPRAVPNEASDPTFVVEQRM